MEKQELNEIKQNVKDIKESVDFLIKNAVTKTDLDEKLNGFATKTDLDEKLNGFATKTDLDEKLNGFATKTDLDEKFNSLMNSIDSVMGELKSSRQEDIMKVGRDDRQDEEIGQVKNRVTAVEHRIGMEPMMA